jgi:hypothetical protein
MLCIAGLRHVPKTSPLAWRFILLCLTALETAIPSPAHAQSTPSPWAVILCKIRSDATGQFDPASEPPNAPGVLPFRTVAENFFTNPNAGFNAVRFFSDMSHGTLDLSGSQVFGWYTIDVNVTGYTADGPTLDKTQGEVGVLARQAASNAGVPIDSFDGLVVILNIPTGWAQGAPGIMWADWRRVDGRNFDGTLGPRGGGGGNGTEIFGQEMGHGYGLDHSRRDGSAEDYQDMWDIMSTANAFSAPDDDYCARGPGLNAWNMRGRGWLDESRVWRDTGQCASQTVELRPLHRKDLSGYLAAELPGMGGHSAYLVEFRAREDWDSGIPRSAVFVHRFEGAIGQDLGTHSYIMSGIGGTQDLAAGDVFESDGDGDQYSRVEVLSIDEAQRVATARLSFSTNPADTTPPSIECPADITAFNDRGQCGAVVNYTANATDDCTGVAELTCDMPSSSTFPVGRTRSTCTATDGAGNSASCSFMITVVDNEPPTIALRADPDELWPPNHRLEAIHADVGVGDNCSGSLVRLVSIGSSEPDNDRGDGNRPNDIQGADLGTADFDFLLRSERSGRGKGRSYIVCYDVTDLAGNSKQACDTVFVPH